jgi:hypothetical protein
MKNTLVVLFLIAFNFSTFGQDKKVSNYKYIIVPENFAFLKQKDQYQTSSLTKFLLKKNGFTVVLDSERYPQELRDNPCKALTANVVDLSSMFRTAVSIELKNCSKKVVYTTNEGTSKLKDYKKSFHESIRAAHASMGAIQYVALSNLAEIEEIQEQGKAAALAINKAEETAIIVEKLSVNNAITETNTLYAQPNENGFQLINLKPAVVFLILKTNMKDVFIISDKNGVLYKKGLTWIAEFYENGRLVEKKYQLKF